MPKIKDKFGLLSVILLFTAACIGTINLFKPIGYTPPPAIADTFIINRWKAEKLKLQQSYEVKLSALRFENDSLRKQAEKEKQSLVVYRKKSKLLKQQLEVKIHQADKAAPDSLQIKPFAESYFNAMLSNDSACDSVIKTLETVIANRDSAIVIHKQNEDNFREMQKQQELREQQLSDELATAYKVQKKKNRQTKFLTGALIFLSGLSSVVVIGQSLK